MNSRKFLVLGLPGSGKGTQGARLAEHFHVPLIGSGALIRQQIELGTEFGRKVADRIAAGNFAPDCDIIYIVTQRLLQPDAAHGYVLDGFPRDIEQAIEFDERHGKHAAELIVLELKVPETTVIARLGGRRVCPKCGRIYNETQSPPRVAGYCDADGTVLTRRPDDSTEAIHHRMDVYDRVTAPIVSYYANSHRLTSVDADADDITVFQRILNAVSAVGLTAASV